MKIDTEFMKKLLVGGMAFVFILILISCISEKDNVAIFVNGDEVSRDAITIGSIVTTADTYEFNPGETMEISMVVMNKFDGDYDFTVTVWEEKELASQEVVAFESEPVTIQTGDSHTFSTEHKVPLEPGEYFYSIISFYSPVGHPNFATYDDGAYFKIKVLDTTPVADGSDVIVTETPVPTETDTEVGTPIATSTPATVGAEEDEDDTPWIDLDDEPTQIGIALIIMASIPIIGFFVIRRKNKNR